MLSTPLVRALDYLFLLALCYSDENVESLIFMYGNIYSMAVDSSIVKSRFRQVSKYCYRPIC